MSPRSRVFAALLVLGTTASAQDGNDDAATLPPPADLSVPEQAAPPPVLPPPPVALATDGALDTTVDATQPPPPESAPLTESDDDFIDAALAAGQKEIAAAALARGRTSDEDLRELAAMLETAHRASNDELVGLRAGTSSPTSTVDAAVADSGIADLEGRASAEFDDAWLQWQAAAHANAIALFRRTADSATHSEAVRRFALDTLPHLQLHAARIAALRSARASAVADTAD